MRRDFMKHTASLTQGNILQVLLRFSIPFLLANLLQALYGAADLMIIGAYCPAESIAAVSTGTQVTQIITSVISGLTLGATILVAKYAGRQQPDKIEKTIGTTITFFALFSIILSLILAFSTGMILQLLQVPQASMAQAYQYVFICITGIFFICEYNAFSALLRGYGDSISPLLFVAAACVCNIAGDLFTVGVLHMGVAGTAISTVASQGISMLIAIWYMRRQGSALHFSRCCLKLDKAVLKELIAIGIPVSFQECMVRFSFLYLTAITNGFGVYAASAVGIASKFDIFAMLPATSVSNALTALTAQNLAAGKKERAVGFVRYGICVSMLCSSLFFLWAQLSPQSMISLFSRDAAVIRAGIPFLRGCSLDYLAVSILFCMNGYLNGSEKTVFTMLNCCGGALVIRVPLLFALMHYRGEVLAVYGLVSPLSSTAMLVVIWFYMKKHAVTHNTFISQNSINTSLQKE